MFQVLYRTSLCKALYPSNPDLKSWIDSNNEEKQGLVDHEVYDSISKSYYLALRRAGNITKAIYSICVLVVKNNK